MQDILDELTKTDTSKEKFKEYRDEDSPLSRSIIEDFLPDERLVLSELPLTSKIRAFVVSDSVVLMPLDDILPECSFLTRYTDTPRLACLSDQKHCTQVASNCTSKLLKRLGEIASAKEEWQLYIMYWRLYVNPDKNKDRRFALIIWAEDTNMALMPINRYQLDYFLNRRSKKYEIIMELL